MTSNIIPINQARQHLGELVDETFYLGKPFLIKRGNKPMAAIIGTAELARMLELVETYDPGLADTLAIMADPELQAFFEEGDREVREGKLLPFDESILD